MANSPRNRLVLLWLLLGVQAALAQRASLTGEVRDPSGLGIPQVQLTVVNLDQGLTREALTNTTGGFSFLLLQPGRYVVEAQKSGFAAAEVTGIELHVGDNRFLQVLLPVAGARVSIQVTDRNDDVDTAPGLSYVVSGDTIRQAPLITRDVLDLALLQPGVLPVNPDGFSGVSSFTIAGNRTDSISFLLDGAHNNNLLDNSITFDPNPDTISEFKIMTTGYTAEYGRNGGGEISLLTKSGTRSLHGTVFDYVRNDRLDANSYFNHANGVPRDALKRNQFGATLGGPLVLPGTPSGKNRSLFFFLAYQGTIQNADTTVTTDTFTPLELAGNFSQSVNNGADPAVVFFLQHNPSFQPDPGMAAQAIIAPSAISAVANAYIQHGLVPARAGGVLKDQAAEVAHVHEFTGKVDWEASARQKISATLGGDRGSDASPFDFGDGSVPGFPTKSRSGDNFLNLTHVLTIRPTLLNEFRVGIERNFNNALLPANQQPGAAGLGIQINQDASTGPPLLVFNSGLIVGYNPVGPQRIFNNTFSYSDTLTWVHKAHSLKFGAGLSAFQDNISNFDFYVNGAFFFASGNSAQNGGDGTGNERADFLLGFPYFYKQGPAARSNIRSKTSYVFVNDEYRVRPSLVLTGGLRYEYATPKTDTQNRIFSIVPGHKSIVFPNAPVGMVFPGDSGAPKGANFPDRTNFAPRFGLVWNPDASRKFTVRTAAGVFFDILKAEDNFQFNGQEPFYASAGVNFPNFAQPYTTTSPDPFPSLPPTASTSFVNFLPINNFGSVFVVDPHLRSPRIYQYSLGVERQWAWDSITSVAYVGSSSHGLTALVDVNPVVLGTTARILNLAPGNTSCDGSQSSPQCSFAALPEFRNAANASFNSLQASLRKLAHSSPNAGRSYFTLAYTYSHNIDNASGFRNRNSQIPYYHPDLFRTSSDFDLRHRLVLSGGWDLPLDSWAAKAPRAVTTGWSLFPILFWRSGFPLDVLANLSPSFASEPGPSGAGDPGLVRANLVGPIQILDPHNASHFYFNPASFSNDPAGYPSDQEVVGSPSLATYGTLPRNAFRGPGRFNINLAVAKSFTLGAEHSHLEIRADFFNLMNHAGFADPVTNISNSVQFGQIVDTAPPRIIQLSGRIVF